MSRYVTIKAPAKVNLHLEICGRRTDGFHEIMSIFQAVDLHDELCMRVAGGKGALRIIDDTGLPQEKNIIGRAVAAFRAETGVMDGLEIEVKKRIPMGAGMGGGSSDAAAALRGLRAMFEGSMEPRVLSDLGSRLGSDVPFFLSAAAALVVGRGEKVDLLEARCDFGLVAVIVGKGVETSHAYRWFDEEERPLSDRRDPAVLRKMYRGPVGGWDFWNDFDGVVMGRRPELAQARDALERAGAAHPRLTGSGAAVIGVLPDARAAEACAGRVAGFPCRVLLPLALMDSIG
jgi:4-diphosphocytidyl-2-C-methyl-D-erythritol kinase